MRVFEWVGPPLRVRWTQAVLAWWYGRPILRRYKPLIRAAFAEGDRVDEARFLARAGYHFAALAQCRVVIETRIRRLAMVSPYWHQVRNGKKATALSHLLTVYGVWPQEMQRRFDKLYAKLSQVLHGAIFDRTSAWSTIERAANFLAEIDRLIIGLVQTGGAV